MLTISGLRNFYFVPKFTDMRCKAPRMLEIIHSRFGGHSQKGTAVKPQPKGRDDDRDDFDGTQNPDAGAQEAADTAVAEDSGRTESGKARPERKGMKYSTMDARYKKTHLCDRTRLPEGSVIISTEMRKVFDRVCYVVEHDYEYVTYRLADGSMRTDHFPMEGDAEPARTPRQTCCQTSRSTSTVR